MVDINKLNSKIKILNTDIYKLRLKKHLIENIEKYKIKLEQVRLNITNK